MKKYIKCNQSLNPDVERRDTIIFGDYDPDKYVGGIRRFNQLTLPKLKALIDEGFVDVDDCQNMAPSISEFYEFVEQWGADNYWFLGYAVSPERSDYRISIDGIDRNKRFNQSSSDKEEKFAFRDFCNGADDFSIRDASAWWS